MLMHHVKLEAWDYPGQKISYNNKHHESKTIPLNQNFILIWKYHVIKVSFYYREIM